MARPPKDPNPVASTGGVANAQGTAIFTGDWNSLRDDYVSLSDSSPQVPTVEIVFLDDTVGFANNMVGWKSTGTTVAAHMSSVGLQIDSPTTAFSGVSSIAALFDTSNLKYINALSWGITRTVGGITFPVALLWGDDGTLFAAPSGPSLFISPVFSAFNSKASDPGIADIPTNMFSIYKNTGNSITKLMLNDNGTMKPVGLQVMGRGRVTGQTAAVGSLATFTVGSVDSTFEIMGNVNVTSFTLGSFNMTVAYTDETSTARSLTLNFSTLTGTLGVSIGAAGPFEGIPSIIRAKTATTITIATSGTFTNLTYNAEGSIVQVV